MKLMIRQLRKVKNLTQGELAKRLAVDIKTVGNWELGKTLPNIQQVWDMAIVLGSDVNELLGWYEDHPRETEPNVSRDEKLLLQDYRSATPERKRALTMTARDYAGMSQTLDTDLQRDKAV